MCSSVSRYDHYKRWADTIQQAEGGYDRFSRGHERFGLNVQPNGDITYAEWAPGVVAANLVGDFSASVTLPRRGSATKTRAQTAGTASRTR